MGLLMKSRGLSFCVMLAPFAAAPQDLPPGVLLVSRVKARVREQIGRLPQYACLETLERSHKLAGPKTELKPQDTVRLEILFTGKKEFYDSPGGRNFTEENPSSFVGGLIGSGMFAGHLQTLFVNDRGLFTYRGEDALAGHRAARCGYRVPALTSGYIVATPSGTAVVSMTGSFWAGHLRFDPPRNPRRRHPLPA